MYWAIKHICFLNPNMALYNSVLFFVVCFCFLFFVSHSHHKIILQSIFVPRVCTTDKILKKTPKISNNSSRTLKKTLKFQFFSCV